MLNVITAGLPVTAKEIIMDAMNSVFGESGVEIIELDDVKLKSRVRMSQRNPSDVLVVLDGVSNEKCKGIENGLYASDKYHGYSDDTGLVEFLNAKYGTNISLEPEDTMELSPEVSAEVEEQLELVRHQLHDRDLRIKNLVARISELSAIVEGEELSTPSVDTEEVSKLNNEILSLKSTISDLQSDNSCMVKEIEAYEIKVEEISKNTEEDRNRLNQLRSDYKSISGELTDYKVKYSIQDGLLTAKDSELESLKKTVADLSMAEQNLRILRDESALTEKHLKAAQKENSQLTVELSSKDAEIERLRDQLKDSVSDDAYKGLESKCQTLEGKTTQLEKTIIDLQSQLSESEEISSRASSVESDLRSENEELKQKYAKIKERIQEQDANMVLLNTELIQAKATAEMLEKSTNRDTDIEALYKELGELRMVNSELQRSVFNRIGAMSNPNSSLTVNLTLSQDIYKNIRFVFSGSTESRKGTYRALLDEFKGVPQTERIVIVDATSETCVDYVFEIEKVKRGLDWFIKGGGVQPYLSNTCLPNVQVLSPGLGYINDCYFLSIDWESRLLELENSGYHVVLYCGDISSMVGRVMHEAFASLGNSIIYIHGNALGARTVVSNLKGISNGSKSLVCYFDYNRKVEKFYNMVARNNECRVISLA